MDKLKTIKIKYQDGTYSNEIPIGVSIDNIDYNDTKTLKQVLGDLDINKGTIEERLTQSETKVDNAVSKASLAETKADVVDARLDNIIIESGTSEAETVAARTNSDGQTFNTLGDRLDTQFGEIKEDLSDINDRFIEESYTLIQLDGNPSSGYKLNGTGAATLDSLYQLNKYAVTAGKLVQIKTNHMAQFQYARPTKYNPSEENTLVGEVFNEGTFEVTVPSTATYLVISLLKTDTTVRVSLINREEINIKPDAELSSTSKNPVQNKVVTGALNGIIPTEVKSALLDLLKNATYIFSNASEKIEVIEDWALNIVRVPVYYLNKSIRSAVGAGGTTSTSSEGGQWRTAVFNAESKKYKITENGTHNRFRFYGSNSNLDASEYAGGTVTGIMDSVDDPNIDSLMEYVVDNRITNYPLILVYLNSGSGVSPDISVMELED